MANSRAILLTGATGTVGRPLAVKLAGAPGVRVRALVRDPAAASDLTAAGAELVKGRFEEAAALARAADGVDTLVLITAASSLAPAQAHAAIDAARGARRIVRLSAVKAGADGPTANTRQHARTEAEIRATGAAFVFLRPMAFFQNLLWSAGTVLSDGTLYDGAGDARLGLIDTRDVVDALERVTLSEEHDGETHELTGPRAVSYAEVAESLARALGRPVRYVPVGPEALAEFARKSGADDWTATLVRDYAAAYASGWGDFTTPGVERLTGHPPRGVDEFVREVFVPATAQAR